MHFIDDSDNPSYPMNGKLEFDAFGKVEHTNNKTERITTLDNTRKRLIWYRKLGMTRFVNATPKIIDL